MRHASGREVAIQPWPKRLIQTILKAPMTLSALHPRNVQIERIDVLSQAPFVQAGAAG
jgi:hypothetical protein